MKHKYFSFLFVITLIVCYALIFHSSYYFFVLLFPIFFFFKEKVLVSFLLVIFILHAITQKEKYNDAQALLGSKYEGTITVINSFYGQKKAFVEASNGINLFISFKDTIRKNDVYYVKGEYVIIKANRNPASFNQNLFAFQNRVYIELKLYEHKLISQEKSFFSVTKNYLDNFSKNRSAWYKSILFASLIGDKSYMGSEQSRLFSSSGLSHFFALSGLHVGLLIFILFAVLKQFIKSYKLRICIIVIFLMTFIAIVGLKAPIFRASLMAIFILFAFYFERYKSIYHILWVTAILNLCLFPHDAFSLSFYLSYSVFFAIIYFSYKTDMLLEPLTNYNIIYKSLKYLILALSPTFASIIFMLIFFGEFPISTFLNNLFILPLLLVFFYGAIVALICFSVLPLLSETINIFLDWFIILLVDIIKIFNLLPAINNNGNNLFFLLCFFLIILFLNRNNFKIKPYLNSIIFIVFALFITKLYLNEKWLHIRVFDLGQAQSVLVSNSSQHVLFDAGKDLRKRMSKNSSLENAINRLGIDSIDFLFLSHWDYDHYGNHKSIAIKKRYFYQNKENFNKADSIYLLKNMLIVNNIMNHKYFDENNRSLVSKLYFGSTSFLFLGDIGFKRERILTQEFPVQSNFAMAAHHGSKFSNSKNIIDKINPEITVFSVGLRNRYKHPSEIVLKRYYSKKYRTDEESYLHFISNGKEILLLPRFISFLLFE